MKPLTMKPLVRRRRLMIAAGLACALMAAIVWMRMRSTPPPVEDGTHDVPLGVEEAVVISYRGPRLEARPYRRGASINVRIAAEAQRGPVRVYDVRYVVSQPGEFDLADYLTSADGSPLEGLPRFKVRGQTRLTKDIETRIREIEDVGVHIGHWYYETLAGLGVLWVVWLVGLVLIGRPRRPPKAAAPVPPPSLAEQVAKYLAAATRGELSSEEKARLESLLLQVWRERLGMQEDRMAVSCRQMQQDGAVGPAYQALVAWLHARDPHVDAADIVRQCTPLLKP